MPGAARQTPPPNGHPLITAFLQAKLRDAKTSVALYSVSSDVDGARISNQMGLRAQQAIAQMLATSREALSTDPQLVASMLHSIMTGVSRRMLESGAPEKQLNTIGKELITMACAYLDACAAPEMSHAQAAAVVSHSC